MVKQLREKLKKKDKEIARLKEQLARQERATSFSPTARALAYFSDGEKSIPSKKKAKKKKVAQFLAKAMERQ